MSDDVIRDGTLVRYYVPPEASCDGGAHTHAQHAALVRVGRIVECKSRSQFVVRSLSGGDCERECERCRRALLDCACDGSGTGAGAGTSSDDGDEAGGATACGSLNDVHRRFVLDWYNEGRSDADARAVVGTALCVKTMHWTVRRIHKVVVRTVVDAANDSNGDTDDGGNVGRDDDDDDDTVETAAASGARGTDGGGDGTGADGGTGGVVPTSNHFYAFTSHDNVMGSQAYPDPAHGRPIYLASRARGAIDNVRLELLAPHPSVATARLPAEGDFVVGVVQHNKQGPYFAQWALCGAPLVHLLRALRYGFVDSVRALLQRLEVPAADVGGGDELCTGYADVYKAMAIMCFYKDEARIRPEWSLPTLRASMCEPCYVIAIGVSDDAAHVCRPCLDGYRDGVDQSGNATTVRADGGGSGGGGGARNKHANAAADGSCASKQVAFEAYWPQAILWWQHVDDAQHAVC